MIANSRNIRPDSEVIKRKRDFTLFDGKLWRVVNSLSNIYILKRGMTVKNVILTNPVIVRKSVLLVRYTVYDVRNSRYLTPEEDSYGYAY